MDTPVFSPFYEDLVNSVISSTRVFKDFPKNGVDFLDLNPLFLDPELVLRISESFSSFLWGKEKSVVLAPEARGFILAPVIAQRSHSAFIPIRKRGKLPRTESILSVSYGTEYSNDCLELDSSLVSRFKKPTESCSILIYDDVLATGGTAEACFKLVQCFEPFEIFFCFLSEIKSLGGRNRLIELGVPESNIVSFIKA